MPPVQRGAAIAEAPTVPHFRPVAQIPAFALGPVLTIASLTGLVLLAVSTNYGYLSDELYFLAAGKYYLDWGYMDQQPLVPLLAAAMDHLAPGSLLVFRLPAVIVAVLGVIVTAQLAREFGGGRRAQALAAAAYPLSPWLLLSGHWLAAASMEPLQWATIMWLLARWVRLHHLGVHRDRLLLAAGLVITLAVQTKFQVGILCVAVLVSVAVCGPRELFRRPLFWGGAALPLLTSVPTLVWQAVHHWPALEMGGVVRRESDPLLVLPTALLYSGLVVGAALCCYGMWQLLRSTALRDFRFLGWSIVGVALFYLLVSGRANYFASFYAPLFAAAAVDLGDRWTGVHRARWSWLAWPALALSLVLPAIMAPIYPVHWLKQHPELASPSRLYETGWPELARTVARAYRSLPPDVRRRTVIVGETYHIAGALDIHGRALGLPRTYSPHRGYYFFGRPPEHAETVLYVGTRSLGRQFGSRQEMGTVESDLVNLAQGVTIIRHDGPTKPWSRLWPELRSS